MEPTTLSAAPTQTQSPQIISQDRVEFSGKAGEFFGIWSVNILLSILTLGI